MKKHLIIVGIVFLFISSTVPITFGNTNTSKERLTIEDYNRYLYPEYYDSYSVDEIPEKIRPYISNNYEEIQDISNSEIINHKETPKPLAGPMDSAWPMYCHDSRHTGRSPYGATANPGLQKWWFDTVDEAYGSPIIDEQGVIYVGSTDFYAVYPNGTMKWKYDIPHRIKSSPAIDENGIIYFGTIQANPNYLYAVYTSNGTLKWKYQTGDVWSSPTIGDDGTIYFGEDCNINALYPNGTLKWKYSTNAFIFSSPAIGLDGTIFFGAMDEYVYALYQNNGTLRWKFSTGNWVHGSPSIGDDGTVYIGSDADLYALYPNNGTMKWKLGIGAVWGSPALDENGILYVGVWERVFYAIYSNNGTIKWRFENCGQVWWTSASVSADGTIYFGSQIEIGDAEGGELIALNPDGTERWRILLAYDYIWSAPTIGEDGTVYIGSVNDGYHPGGWGYLHAIGELDSNAPSAPEIDGIKRILPFIEYKYKFKATSPLSNDIFYWIEWGDNSGGGWRGPYSSGEQITVKHTWYELGSSTIRAKAKDTNNLWGPWGELEVTMPRNKATYNSLFLRFLERLPLLERFLSMFTN